MIKLGIVMDPISNIDIKKDSSFAMLLEAQSRGYEIYYMEISDLYLFNGEAFGHNKKITRLTKNLEKYYEFESKEDIALKALDVILMRKNPPVDIEYIYATYILEKAEQTGTLIINKPQSLRDCNEKFFTTCFSEIVPTTLVSRNKKKIKNFYKKQEDIIIKPLDGMQGHSIFRLMKNDPNVNVIIEMLTQYGKRFCMAQNYLPAIKEGDKRVFLIDGKPFPYCLARIPNKDETRGNLAVGGFPEIRVLTECDLKIANRVSLLLKEKGLMFIGLDIIGDKLTEINITSPTCICEIEEQCPSISITNILFNAIEAKLHKNL